MATLVRSFRPVFHERFHFRVHDSRRAAKSAVGILNVYAEIQKSFAELLALRHHTRVVPNGVVGMNAISKPGASLRH